MRLSRLLTRSLALLTMTGLVACAGETSDANDETAPGNTGSSSPGASDPGTASPSAPSDLPPAPPAPPAIEKPITPITLYTVSGTNVPAREGYQADVAKGVDPSRFVWEPIDYPAQIMPMDASANQGVASLVQRIQAKPGKFALVGFSQGSIVISRVYDALRSGGLQGRRQDLVAGVAIGNPMREAGRNIPNGVAISGHGMMSERLGATESLWWEICAPNDLVCSTGDDAVGMDYTAIFEVIRGRAPQPANVFQNILTTLLNPLQALQQIPARATGLQQLIAYLVPGGGNGAHGSYPIFKPIAGDPRSSLELAIDYLDDKAVNQ